MAKKKKLDCSQMSESELLKHSAELEEKIFAMRNELSMQHKLEKPHLLKKMRHERARALTFLTQNRSKTA